MPTASERKTYLDGVADAAIAEREREEDTERDRVRAEAEANQKRAAALERVAKFSAKRLAAVEKAQGAAESLAQALTHIHEIAAEERKAGVEAGVVTLNLSNAALARRFGRYLSETLRSVPAAMTGRYGEMGLARAFRVESNWVTAEQKVLAHMKDGENNDPVE